jgi:hypothetical protein
MSDVIKAMPLFFIDNQAEWPKGAELIGDLVVWPDEGMYPTFQPIASAKLAGFDGIVIVQAGSRRLVVTFLAGAHDNDSIRKAMSDKKNRPEQYCIAVDAIVQRLMLMRTGNEAGMMQDGVHPFSLLAWLAKSHKADAEIIRDALAMYLKAPASPEACARAEDMRHSIDTSI